MMFDKAVAGSYWLASYFSYTVELNANSNCLVLNINIKLCPAHYQSLINVEMLLQKTATFLSTDLHQAYVFYYKQDI